MKNKRVLIIRNSWAFGGAEMHALNLSIALKKNGYEPILVSREPILINRCKENGINYLRGPWHARQGWGNFYKIFSFFIVLWYLAVIKLKKIDIVHAHSRDDFIFATKAAKILNTKVVWTDHADLKYIMKKGNPQDLRSLIAELAKYAARVIIVSNSEKLEVVKQYPAFPNIEVIHNGVFLPLKTNAVKKPKKIIIGATNRLVSTKGIAELITGYSNISNIKNTELWLIGDGDEKDKFMKLANELNIKQYVKFLGFKKNIWRYLAAFDIFIQPTYHEAFSNSLVEASIAGCAVISTRIGGNTEIINSGNGILVPIKNPEAITSAINKYVNSPKLRKYKSEKLKKYAVRNFNFENIVKEKVVPIYES